MIVYYFNQFDAVGVTELEQMMHYSSSQQKALVAGMKTLSRKREQAVSYAMLSYALEHDEIKIKSGEKNVLTFPTNLLFYKPARSPLWAFGEHGKPYLTSHEGVFFNISHCKEAVALAVSDREVGVDVEGRRRFSDNLLERSFNDEEQHAVKHSQDPEMEFAKIWTRKEAWFKYTGTGILMDHLKTTEADARDAGCIINTSPVVATEEGDEVFWLSIAEKRRPIE